MSDVAKLMGGRQRTIPGVARGLFLLQLLTGLSVLLNNEAESVARCASVVLVVSGLQVFGVAPWPVLRLVLEQLTRGVVVLSVVVIGFEIGNSATEHLVPAWVIALGGGGLGLLALALVRHQDDEERWSALLELQAAAATQAHRPMKPDRDWSTRRLLPAAVAALIMLLRWRGRRRD
jgi:hypothetical protein